MLGSQGTLQPRFNKWGTHKNIPLHPAAFNRPLSPSLSIFVSFTRLCSGLEQANLQPGGWLSRHYISPRFRPRRALQPNRQRVTPIQIILSTLSPRGTARHSTHNPAPINPQCWLTRALFTPTGQALPCLWYSSPALHLAKPPELKRVSKSHLLSNSQ